MYKQLTHSASRSHDKNGVSLWRWQNLWPQQGNSTHASQRLSEKQKGDRTGLNTLLAKEAEDRPDGFAAFASHLPFQFSHFLIHRAAHCCLCPVRLLQLHFRWINGQFDGHSDFQTCNRPRQKVRKLWTALWLVPVATCRHGLIALTSDSMA